MCAVQTWAQPAPLFTCASVLAGWVGILAALLALPGWAWKCASSSVVCLAENIALAFLEYLGILQITLETEEMSLNMKTWHCSCTNNQYYLPVWYSEWNLHSHCLPWQPAEHKSRGDVGCKRCSLPDSYFKKVWWQMWKLRVSKV